MKETIILCGQILFCYVMLNIMLKTVIVIIVSTIIDKFAEIKIKIPASKKYKANKTPIYKLSQYWDSDIWVITKYEQKHQSSWWSVLTFPLIPILPISIYTVQYVECGDQITVKDMHRSNMNELEYANLDIAEYYELKFADITKEYNRLLAEKNKVENIVSKLNKEFNENYIE
jgi:hypothetical protein